MNFQSVRTQSQYPGKYRHDLLVDRLSDTNASPREIAKNAGISHVKLYQALDGNCKKIDTLWRIATALKIKWNYLFDFDLKKSQFHRAVERGST